MGFCYSAPIATCHGEESNRWVLQIQKKANFKAKAFRRIPVQYGGYEPHHVLSLHAHIAYPVGDMFYHFWFHMSYPPTAPDWQLPAANTLTHPLYFHATPLTSGRLLETTKVGALSRMLLRSVFISHTCSRCCPTPSQSRDTSSISSAE